jgi:hypothetical protein
MARFLIIVFALLSTPVGAESGEHRIFGPVDGLQSLRADPRSGGILLKIKGDWRRLRLNGADLVFAPSDAPGPAVPKGAIPHSRVAVGTRDIRLAWLAGATGRYGHGVLGDAVEAGELRVRTEAGQTLRYVLADEYVFEDLEPRLADVDGDGKDEVLLVRSHEMHGAAAVLLGIRGGKLERVAESDAIGLANRWLNPVGIADFDGDGRNEVAVVETPHIGGKLLLFELEGRKLRETARRPGYSTHGIGSTVLAMAAIFDADGDGVVDIMLPTQDRRTLATVTFAKGKFRNLERVGVKGRIVSAVVLGDIDGHGRLDTVFWDTSARIHVILR